MAMFEYGAYEELGTDSRGSWMDHLDWGSVRQEVEMEARAEIVLLGPQNVGKSTLYAALRGMPFDALEPRLGLAETALAESLGLFTLLDLPPGNSLDEMLLERLAHATLLVYLLDGAMGAEEGDLDAVVRPQDVRWLARLHALGHPMMIAVTKADLWAEMLPDLVERTQQRLGEPVTPVCALGGDRRRERFLQRLTTACPQLAVPLAREVIGFRRYTARRLILRTALLTGMVSLVPIPLLDLPVQLNAQIGLVARIATMYGHLPTHDYCHELVVAAAGGGLLCAGVQQLAKAVPVFGWAVSGLLSGVATWVVGYTALVAFERQISIERALGHAPELMGTWQRVFRRCWSAHRRAAAAGSGSRGECPTEAGRQTLWRRIAVRGHALTDALTSQVGACYRWLTWRLRDRRRKSERVGVVAPTQRR